MLHSLNIRIVPGFSLLSRPAALFLITLAWWPAQAILSAPLAPARPALEVPKLVAPPVFEDFLDPGRPGPSLARMAHTSGFLQRDPSDGQPASQDTDVYLGYDQDHFYAVFVAHDTEPDKIRARQERRENIMSDDQVEIMIDTFLDQRRAYMFLVNPYGIQWDAIWTEGQSIDSSFDLVWNSRGQLTPHGYVAMITIPFKSLRFPAKPVQDWGIILNRAIPRTSENTFWPRISSRNNSRLSQSAIIRGLELNVRQSHFQLIPYGTFRSYRTLQSDPDAGYGFVTDRADPDAGIDGKMVWRNSLVFDATFNPDFSQVESDSPQVTVNQRFEVFFPEKRPFFLENADFFKSPLNLVFTRRIVDPQAGARMTGKLGPYSLGVMLTDDEYPGKVLNPDDPDSGKRAYFGIFRFSRDILNDSNMGLIFTTREFAGSFNRILGADTRIRFSPAWTATLQAVASSTRHRSGSTAAGPAYYSSLKREGRKFNFQFTYQDISPGFNAAAGFINRTGYRKISQSVSYRFRPEGRYLIAWGPDFSSDALWDHRHLSLEKGLSASMNFNFSRETNLGAGLTLDQETLRPEDHHSLAVNSRYRYGSQYLFFRTSLIPQISFNGEYAWGSGVNYSTPAGLQPFTGLRSSSSLGVTVRPFNALRIDNSYLLSRLVHRDGASIFNNHILRTKWNWQFNREWSLRVILQYDTTLPGAAYSSLKLKKVLNTDILLTYLLNPGTALYAGFNNNTSNLRLAGEDGFRRLEITRDEFLHDSRVFFVKFSYLFHF